MFKSIKGLDLKPIDELEILEECKPVLPMVQYLSLDDIYRMTVKDALSHPEDYIVYLTEDIADAFIRHGYIDKPEIAGREARLLEDDMHAFM